MEQSSAETQKQQSQSKCDREGEAKVNSDGDVNSPPPLYFGYSALTVWRVAFYIIMAYTWGKSVLGPFGGWTDATTYDHAEWVYDFAPKTFEATERLRWFSVAVALLSIFSDTATNIFALLAGQLIFTNLVCFINHYYLFFLLATLMAFYCNCGKDNVHNKAGWIHAIRGQIVVVYAFASLWKFDSDWLNGGIVEAIFLSFEEQGDHRGIPWSDINASYPGIFSFIALSGIFLDSMLFLVLMFLPPGHKLQALGLVFHGFTAYTMAERIGYSFPLTMIFSGFAFQRSDVVDKDQESLGGDTLSHFQWLSLQIQLWKRANQCKPKHAVQQHVVKTKKQILPLLFLVIQWLIPLRMPLVSHGEFKYTFEGYRWSWTMMLHSKFNIKSPGLSFMSLRPKCGSHPFPNPLAKEYPVMDPHSFPYEFFIMDQERVTSVLQMFPRQMPKLSYFVEQKIGDQCPKVMTMTTSYFSSVNDGPYHRIIDPTSDLLEVHRSHSNLTWPSKLWYAVIDKAPIGQEFVLRGTGSVNLPLASGPKRLKDEITFVDRSPCLQVDPIKVHLNSFQIQFEADSEVDLRLSILGCPDATFTNCERTYINQGEQLRVPRYRTVLIGIDEDLGMICSETRKEDVVIKLTSLVH